MIARGKWEYSLGGLHSEQIYEDNKAHSNAQCSRREFQTKVAASFVALVPCGGAIYDVRNKQRSDPPDPYNASGMWSSQTLTDDEQPVDAR